MCLNGRLQSLHSNFFSCSGEILSSSSIEGSRMDLELTLSCCSPPWIVSWCFMVLLEQLGLQGISAGELAFLSRHHEVRVFCSQFLFDLFGFLFSFSQLRYLLLPFSTNQFNRGIFSPQLRLVGCFPCVWTRPRLSIVL